MMCDDPEKLIEAFRQASILHGMEKANFSTLGCLFDISTTERVTQEQEDKLRDYLYNGDMTDESEDRFILPEGDNLDDLIDEFLDFVGYFGIDRGASLSFDTRIATLEREDVERLVREFIRYAKNEPPDPDYMRRLQMGEDLDDVE